MPLLCLLQRYGFGVYLYYGDHPPAHVHVVLKGERVATINILEPQTMQGNLPAKQKRYLVDWVLKHQNALMKAWEQAQNWQQPDFEEN